MKTLYTVLFLQIHTTKLLVTAGWAGAMGSCLQLSSGNPVICYCFLFVQDRTSLCSPGCPSTHLKITGIFLSQILVLGSRL